MNFVLSLILFGFISFFAFEKKLIISNIFKESKFCLIVNFNLYSVPISDLKTNCLLILNS